LDSGDGVEGGEDLLVAFCINDYVCKQGHARSIKGVASKAGIENFNGDVLNARAMFSETLMDCRVMVSAHENDSDSSCFSVDNGGIVGDGGGETHSIKKLSCSVKVSNCNNNVINTACNSVEFAALCVASKLDGRWFIA
jgi:hypothetical protein